MAKNRVKPETEIFLELLFCKFDNLCNRNNNNLYFVPINIDEDNLLPGISNNGTFQSFKGCIKCVKNTCGRSLEKLL